MLTGTAQRIDARLEARLPIVLDGGARAALMRAGMEVDQPLGVAAVLQGHSHVLSSIHQSYCAAGVHILRTNTSATTPQALARAGYGYRAAKLTSFAVDLAMEAAESSGRNVCVAGLLPTMDGTDDRLRTEQVAHAQRLMASGCDLIFIETAHTLREAVAATAAASQTALPVLVALSVGESGHLADGEHLDTVCAALAGAGARGFIAVPSDPAGEIRAMAELASMGRPWGVLYAGPMELSPAQYAQRAAELAEEGATLFGGEPLATAEHVQALIARVPGAERELRRPSGLPHAFGRLVSNLPPRL